MSIFDRFLNKHKDKRDGHQTDDEMQPADPAQPENENAFMERIRQFALQARPES